MRAVTDASPLHYLVLIRSEHVLPRLFDEVMVPPAVIAELTHQRAPEIVRAWARQPPDWLNIIAAKTLLKDQKLGIGESAAISLAVEQCVDAILIDERDGTHAARNLGLKAIGTIGILAVAAERKIISLQAAFSRLSATSFRGPKALMDALIKLDADREE